MSDLNPALIAALAEGSLPPAEAARVAELIAADPAAQRELELQRRALAALRGAARPVLTTFERARLRNAVAPAAPAPARSSPVARRWPRLAFAAVLLLVVAVAAPLIRSLSRSGNETTTAPALTLPAAGPEDADMRQATVPEEAAAPQTSEAAFADDAAAATTTTTTTATLAEETPDQFTNLGQISEEAFSDYFRTYSEGITGGVEETPLPEPADPLAGDTINVETAKCAAQDLFPDAIITPQFSAEVDGRRVDVYTINDNGGLPTVVAVDRSACEIIDL